MPRNGPWRNIHSRIIRTVWFNTCQEWLPQLLPWVVGLDLRMTAGKDSSMPHVAYLWGDHHLEKRVHRYQGSGDTPRSSYFHNSHDYNVTALMHNALKGVSGLESILNVELRKPRVKSEWILSLALSACHCVNLYKRACSTTVQSHPDEQEIALWTRYCNQYTMSHSLLYTQ